jgi:hypothetical protein
MQVLSALVAVVEQEVQIGESLLLNLAAQKAAILAWDSTALLQRVEEKEQLIRQLETLEAERQEVVRHLFPPQDPSAPEKVLSLKELCAQLPPTPQAATLDLLHDRAQQIYGRLRAEEKNLNGLMGILLGHISEALHSFMLPPAALYGEKGTLTACRPEPGLVHEKI